MPCPTKAIGILVLVCISIFVIYNGKKLPKIPFMQNTKQPPSQPPSQPLKSTDTFVEDLDELINNIYYIQLHTK